MRTQERLAAPRPVATTTAVASAHRGLAYRPALDGIRAIAVLAVFAYHLGFRQVRGGFLGVDVFFVLSGFLITTLLLLEHGRTGRISLRTFWARRARRLLPALLLMLVAVAVWESVTAADFELAQRRTDLLSALFYGSNWNLMASAQDYFAQYQTASMVRHTWSLAIEEQFYILWPLIVLGVLTAARGRTRAMFAVCVLGIAGSAALMAFLYSPVDPSRAYYGTEARVHQLLIGALLAILLARVPAVGRPRRSGSAVALASFVTLLVAFATLGDGNAIYYRGASTVVALATAVLVWGLEVSPCGPIARGLGIAPMRWVGKISYGVYLWHWPVILAVGVPLSILGWMPGASGLAATDILFTFVIAGLSFRLVERPIREGTAPVLRNSLGRTSFALATASVCVAAIIVAATAPPEGPWFEPGSALIDEQGCHLRICVRYEAPGADAPVVAVIGDSVARSLDAGLIEEGRRQGWTVVMAASGGCRISHLLTSVEGDTEEQRPCFEATPSLWRRLLSRWHPDLVIAISTMETYDLVAPDGSLVSRGSPAYLAAERNELGALAQTFVGTGARLAFVAVPPTVIPPECLREETVELPACARSVTDDPVTLALNQTLADVVEGFPGRAFFVSLNDRICPAGRCPPVVDDVLLRYDGSHFTATGARWLVPALFGELGQVGALPASMR